jgi:hypothetical protein
VSSRNTYIAIWRAVTSGRCRLLRAQLLDAEAEHHGDLGEDLFVGARLHLAAGHQVAEQLFGEIL